MGRLSIGHLISGICLYFGFGTSQAMAHTDALVTNQCAVLLLHSPAILRASIPRPVLQKSEHIQIEGQLGAVSLEKIADIHAGLIETAKHLKAIGLKMPKLTHVVLDPESKVSPYAFPYRLIRLREERLIYLNGNDTGSEHQTGIIRIVASHEMIHTSMFSTFSHSARVNKSGIFREAFANFLSYHFDPDLYRKEAAFHPTNLEYWNENNMGAANKGRERNGFSRPTIWGNDHIDGVVLGHFLLRMRNLIGPDEMDKFISQLIPTLNQFSLPDSVNADVELSGADRTSWGATVMGHNQDLLLALALTDRLGHNWPAVQQLLAEFCAATESNMRLERLHEIEKQLVPTL